jgi:hypothetical protein
LAGFEVTLYGRFWVTPAANSQRREQLLHLQAQLPECTRKMTHACVNLGETADSKGVFGAAATLCRQSGTEIAGEP